MSVLIKGMYMPRMCSECAFMSGLICPDNVYTCDCPVADDVCGVNITQAVDEDCRHPDCPLVEVPTPHGRLIDENTALDKLCDVGEAKTNKWERGMNFYDMQKGLSITPTVIEAEDE